LKSTTLETRTSLGWPMFLEWFQWLAEQLEKRQRLEQTPAHVRLTDWRPDSNSLQHDEAVAAKRSAVQTASHHKASRRGVVCLILKKCQVRA
jgi:hypothetical protein